MSNNTVLSTLVFLLCPVHTHTFLSSVFSLCPLCPISFSSLIMATFPLLFLVFLTYSTPFQIIASLDEDPAAQSKQLTMRLQQIAAALENKVTDL